MVNKKLIEEWIQDELKDEKKYRDANLPNIADDEHRHSIILKKILKTM